MLSRCLACGLIAASCLGLPARAQSSAEPPPQVEIINSTPTSVFVRTGGPSDNLRLYGHGFELVKAASVRLHGAVAPKVTARVKNLSRGVAELEVKALPGAEVSEEYELVVTTAKGNVPLQMQVEVAPGR